MGISPIKAEVSKAEEVAERCDVEFAKSVASDAACGCDSRFDADYCLTRKIGKGAFGLVYAAQRMQNLEDPAVAVKVLSWQQEEERTAKMAVRREVASLRALLPSRHVVRLLSCYVEDSLAYIVMEKCALDFVRLLTRMPRITEKTMHLFFEDMLAALAACHAVGIVHRDVKPSNFLVAGGGGATEAAAGAPRLALKLCDFGFAGAITGPDAADELSGLYGTAPFMAPEMLRGDRYGASVDIWALGTLAYVLLFGEWPYRPTHLSKKAIKAAILEGLRPPTYRCRRGFPEVSVPCAAWVRALLRRRPDARPSAADMAEHPMFKAPWGSDEAPDLRRAIDSARRVGAL